MAVIWKLSLRGSDCTNAIGPVYLATDNSFGRLHKRRRRVYRLHREYRRRCHCPYLAIGHALVHFLVIITQTLVRAFLYMSPPPQADDVCSNGPTMQYFLQTTNHQLASPIPHLLNSIPHCFPHFPLVLQKRTIDEDETITKWSHISRCAVLQGVCTTGTQSCSVDDRFPCKTQRVT
jgi:hypothetical protein